MTPIAGRLYLIYGVALALVKFLLDWAVCWWFGKQWSIWLYWSPLRIAGENQSFALGLLAVAVPFTGLGIWLTLRRLLAVQMPAWLVVLFFLPIVNLALFGYLVVAKDQEWEEQPTTRRDIMESGMIAGATACLAIGICVVGLSGYGWGTFLAMPFGIGVAATLLVSRKGPQSFANCAAATILGMFVCGGLLLALAVEGLICLLMAIPVATPLALVGVVMARAIVTPSPNARQAMVALILLPTVGPLIAAAEKAGKAEDPLHHVVTMVEIDAPPQAVWRNVIAFPELSAPEEWLFRLGIAYPIRARIEGAGAGAVRYCEFSTGPFVEPITTWREAELLAFDVSSSPEPMRELSPYDIHPEHLKGFVRSRRGQFELVALDGGKRTRLVGTTWYQQSIYPDAYWSLITDAIIHKIHHRVLDHIRVLSESTR
jgi:hypothetical protein